MSAQRAFFGASPSRAFIIGRKPNDASTSRYERSKSRREASLPSAARVRPYQFSNSVETASPLSAAERMRNMSKTMPFSGSTVTSSQRVPLRLVFKRCPATAPPKKSLPREA